MPKAVPPPAPVTEEQLKEILAQVATIRGQQPAGSAAQPAPGNGANGSSVLVGQAATVEGSALAVEVEVEEEVVVGVRA